MGFIDVFKKKEKILTIAEAQEKNTYFIIRIYRVEVFKKSALLTKKSCKYCI